MIPDTVKILAIRVDFLLEVPDNDCTTGNGKFDLDGNNEPKWIYIKENGVIVDSFHNLCYDPPHDSVYFERQLEAVRNYYLDTSDSTLELVSTVVPAGNESAYTLSNHMAYYGDPTN